MSPLLVRSGSWAFLPAARAAMAGEQRLPGGGGGKLRLKRKRPPEEAARDGAGPPLRGRPPIEGSSSGWFKAQSLSEADRTWLALLKAADPQLNHSTLEKVAKFPEFLTKSSQITNPQPKPETFNIGLEQFQWEPFPLYHREVNMIDLRIPQNSENPATNIKEQEINEDEPSITISPVPERTPLITNEYATERSKTGHSPGHSSKDCGKKMKNSQRTRCQNSPRSVAPAAVQQKLGLPELWKKISTQSQQKSTRGSKKERASNKDTLTQNRITSLLPSQGSPANSSASGFQQKPVCQNEDISTLDCCPMCQFHFNGTLSQLDRDSHLAKCLSESTEDVNW